MASESFAYFSDNPEAREWQSGIQCEYQVVKNKYGKLERMFKDDLLKMQGSFEAQLARLTDDLVAVQAQQSVFDQMQKEYDEKITKMQAAVTALELRPNHL